MTATAPPSFLKARLAKARAEAAQAITDHNQRKALPTPQPDRPTQPSPTTAKPSKATAAPPTKPVANKARKQAKAAANEGCEPDRPKSGVRPALALPIDEAAAVGVFRRNAAGDSEVLRLAEPYIPNVVAAVLRGAMTVGPAGHVDRMTLFRMAGLPWFPNAIKVGGGGELDAASTNRLTNALSRIERRLGGHVPVTVDAVVVEEAS